MNGRHAAGILGALVASGCGGMQSAMNPAGPQARSIMGVWWWFFGVCAVVYVVVIAVLFWALARRHRPSDDRPAVERRLRAAVAGSVGVTVVILVALTVGSVDAGRGMEAPSGAGAVSVDVIGHQWWWEFQYNDVTPSDVVVSPNELHLPVGIPVVIQARSADVIHSFWVPNLRGKRDLIPGIETHTWIQADEPGVYRGQCAEFCGTQHANMAFVVVAEPVAAFQQWLQGQRKAAPEPATELARRGHDVFMTGPCVLCHTIRGTIAGSQVGPDLTHVATRRTIAAGTLPNTPGHRGGWIADSQSIKPGNLMPPNLLSGEDLQALLAYIDTLK
jgi:cytochrome c oxidase subunit II